MDILRKINRLGIEARQKISIDNMETKLSIYLRDKQKEFIKKSGVHNFIRGEGATYACAYKALLKALEEDNVEVCVWSHSIVIAEIIRDIIEEAVLGTSYENALSIVRTGRMITIKCENGSEIYLVTRDCEYLRGYKFKHLIIDCDNLMPPRARDILSISTAVYSDATITKVNPIETNLPI